MVTRTVSESDCGFAMSFLAEKMSHGFFGQLGASAAEKE